MQKVWIFNSSRPFTQEEHRFLSAALDKFIAEWAAHGQKLDCSYELPYDRFIVLKVDEEQAAASGCSIDSMTRFVKELESRLDVSLFDRQQVAYLGEGNVHSTPLHGISQLFRAGVLKEDTPIFDLSLSTGEDYAKGWPRPLRETGYWNFV